MSDNKKKVFDAEGNALADEWMPGEGRRVFPDAKDKNDQTDRAKVKVLIKVSRSAAETIYLKSFDVDDPTENDPEQIIDANDGPQGENGDDNKTLDNLGMPFPGIFAANEDTSITLTVSSDGVATLEDGGDVEFIVGTQPGDNYRIAVALKTEDFDVLGIHSDAEEGYVKPSDEQPSKFDGIVSPMLTVWRKLYLEIDSMTAVPATGAERNYEQGTIETSPGSTLHLSISLTGPAYRYENGHIDITGVGSFVITSNTDNLASHDEVIVQGQPGSAAEGKTFKIYDDDDKYLPELGLPPALPKNAEHADIVNGIQTKFSPAYIQVEDANALGWNANQTVPFILNAPGAGLFGSNVWDGAKDLPLSTERFWSWLVVYGYQPEASADRDPDIENPLLGVTPAHFFSGARFGFSVVYVEEIRETAIGGDIANIQNPIVVARARKDYRDLTLGTAAHEIGHGPSNQSEADDHSEGGLMKEGGAGIAEDDSAFTPKTIKRFRGRITW